MKLVFNIFIFLAVLAFNAELVLSLCGKADIETLSKLNDCDDDEDSDDNSQEEEEEQKLEQKTKEWFAESPLVAEFPVFQPEHTPVFWPTDHFIEFNLIDLPFSPPEFA